jgi:hypothetical protein
VITNPGAYPEPGAEVPVVTQPSVPAGDWSRGEVFVDFSQVITRESYPIQAAVLVSGNMPTPCHQFHYEISQPDAENRIVVEVYSLFDSKALCIQVLQPFEHTIELGSFSGGKYKVILNGVDIGDIDS